jgi:hypothetical protein
VNRARNNYALAAKLEEMIALLHRTVLLDRRTSPWSPPLPDDNAGNADAVGDSADESVCLRSRVLQRDNEPPLLPPPTREQVMHSGGEQVGQAGSCDDDIGALSSMAMISDGPSAEEGISRQGSWHGAVEPTLAAALTGERVLHQAPEPQQPPDLVTGASDVSTAAVVSQADEGEGDMVLLAVRAAVHEAEAGLTVGRALDDAIELLQSRLRDGG